LSEELPVEWPESKPVTIREVGQKTQVEAFKWADQNFNPGLVVSPVLSLGWLDFLRLPRHVELVYAVGCPVLFSRASAEYQNILVGFDGSKSSLAGLDVAVDMARQTGAGLAAGMVMESEVIQGAGSQQWLGQAREVLRETAHIHKLEIQEWVQSGNPVRGLSALAKGADLLILGCNRPQRALLHLNVPELVLRRVDCSVLLVPA
jgi:nucleotide-binding universal stress UspA family protein